MKHSGRKAAGKIWESQYLHAFRTTFLTDPDIHLLIFASGSNTNTLIKAALREFIANHNLPFGSEEFQASLFVEANKILVDDRASPSCGKVFESLKETNPVDDAISSRSFKAKPSKAARVSTRTPKQDAVQPVPHEPRIGPIRTLSLFDANPANPEKKPPNILADMGPELPDDPYGTDVDQAPGPAPTLKSRWLQYHQY